MPCIIHYPSDLAEWSSKNAQTHESNEHHIWHFLPLKFPTIIGRLLPDVWHPLGVLCSSQRLKIWDAIFLFLLSCRYYSGSIEGASRFDSLLPLLYPGEHPTFLWLIPTFDLSVASTFRKLGQLQWFIPIFFCHSASSAFTTSFFGGLSSLMSFSL